MMQEYIIFNLFINLQRGRGGGKCLMKCSWLDVVFRLVYVPLFLVYFVIFATSSGEGEEISGLIPYNA